MTLCYQLMGGDFIMHFEEKYVVKMTIKSSLFHRNKTVILRSLKIFRNIIMLSKLLISFYLFYFNKYTCMLSFAERIILTESVDSVIGFFDIAIVKPATTKTIKKLK